MSDTLDEALAPAALDRQWLALLNRGPAPGQRQVDFLPLETALCALASDVVTHNRFGGSTSHLAPSPVPELALLFHRPPSSVLAKMANVDGSRPNGAKMDLQLGVRVLGDRTATVFYYLEIFASARRAGIGPDRLPDFLGFEASPRFDLLGQEEIESDIDEAVRAVVEDWVSRGVSITEQETERLAVSQIRIGQHKFAAAVMRNYSHVCAFCEMRPPTGAKGFLRASHIKPWRVSNRRERLDPTNGISACPTHDIAFDQGVLTVNGGLRIHVQPEVLEVPRDDPRWHAFGRPPLRETLFLPEGAERPSRPYLQWHREHIWAA